MVRIVKMHDKDGVQYQFEYTGISKGHSNRSMSCGHGSSDWLFLCKLNMCPCILSFSIDASCGSAWLCVTITDLEYENLINTNGEDLNKTYYSHYEKFVMQQKNGSLIHFHPDDIVVARALISSRESLFGSITDKDIYG